MSDLDKTPVYVVLETCQKGPLLRLAHGVCFLTYEAAEDWGRRNGPLPPYPGATPFFILEASREGLLLANTGKYAKEVAKLPRDKDGKLTAYAWPGGYEMVYYHSKHGALCHKCANVLEAKHGLQGGDPDWPIILCRSDETIEHYEECEDCGRVIVDWDDDKNERREPQETPSGP